MVPVVRRWNLVELCECNVSNFQSSQDCMVRPCITKEKRKRGLDDRCKCVKNFKNLLLLPGSTNESWLLKLRN